MNDNENIQDLETLSQSQSDPETVEEPQPENETPQPDGRAKFTKFAVAGIVLAVAAWITLSFEGRVAWALSVLAIMSSCFGLKAPTRAQRNTALTALVASAVLLVVVSAFLLLFLIGL